MCLAQIIKHFLFYIKHNFTFLGLNCKRYVQFFINLSDIVFHIDNNSSVTMKTQKEKITAISDIVDAVHFSSIVDSVLFQHG